MSNVCLRETQRLRGAAELLRKAAARKYERKALKDGGRTGQAQGRRTISGSVSAKIMKTSEGSLCSMYQYLNIADISGGRRKYGKAGGWLSAGWQYSYWNEETAARNKLAKPQATQHGQQLWGGKDNGSQPASPRLHGRRNSERGWHTMGRRQASGRKYVGAGRNSEMAADESEKPRRQLRGKRSLNIGISNTGAAEK